MHNNDKKFLNAKKQEIRKLNFPPNDFQLLHFYSNRYRTNNHTTESWDCLKPIFCPPSKIVSAANKIAWTDFSFHWDKLVLFQQKLKSWLPKNDSWNLISSLRKKENLALIIKNYIFIFPLMLPTWTSDLHWKSFC